MSLIRPEPDPAEGSAEEGPETESESKRRRRWGGVDSGCLSDSDLLSGLLGFTAGEDGLTLVLVLLEL